MLDNFFSTIHRMNKKMSKVSNRDLYYSLHKFFWELSRVALFYKTVKSKEPSVLDELSSINYLPGTATDNFVRSIFNGIIQTEKNG